jgi:ornithine decarboxylase
LLLQDTICRETPMPRLRNGDFVMFPKFGAYTVAGAVNFNGFDVTGAKIYYVYTSAN